MKLIDLPFLAVACVLFSGCATSDPSSGFGESMTFSSFQTFHYKDTLISGMDFRESEEIMLKELSKQVLSEELTDRGFESLDGNGDFFVVASWNKAVSSNPSIFHNIDGARASMNRRNNPTNRFAPRLHLTVEIYETSTGNLVWREELPNIFDAVQMNERRIDASLRRAIADFPERADDDFKSGAQ